MAFITEEEADKVNPFPNALDFLKKIIVLIFVVLLVKYVSFLSLPALGNFSVPGIPLLGMFPRYMDGQPFLQLFDDVIKPKLLSQGLTKEQIIERFELFKQIGIAQNSNPFPDSKTKNPIQYRLVFTWWKRALYKIAQFFLRVFSFGALMITQSIRALLILIFNKDWYYETCYLRNLKSSNESLLSYLLSIGIDKLIYNEAYPYTKLHDPTLGRIDKVKHVLKPMMPIFIFSFLFSVFLGTVGFKNMVIVLLVLSMVLFSLFRGVFKVFPFEGLNSQIMKWKLFPSKLIGTIIGFEFSQEAQLNINKRFDIMNEQEKFLPPVLINSMMDPNSITVQVLPTEPSTFNTLRTIAKELPEMKKKIENMSKEGDVLSQMKSQASISNLNNHNLDAITEHLPKDQSFRIKNKFRQMPKIPSAPPMHL